MKILKLGLAVLSLIALAPIDSARAQTWPARPIQLIIPQGAGGSTDAAGRMVAQALAERLGQAVVIDNRAGANGGIGVAAAAKAPADGYSFLLGSNTTMAANTFLYKNYPVDPLKDFVPLALAANADFLLAVPAASPYKTVKDLIAAAKAAPGKLNYGSGTGSALLCGELLKAAAGVNIVNVPYKSSAQGLTDLIGGQLDLICEPLSSSQPHIRAGRLRALALANSRRTRLAPELETAVEAGVPGMHYSAWIGFYAPAAMPKDIAARLSGELLKILRDPAIADKLRGIGFDAYPLDPEAFAALHRAEMTSLAAVVKAAGIKAE